MKKKKTDYFMHGGERTPQYFCPECKHAHTIHSEKGKAHAKFRRK